MGKTDQGDWVVTISTSCPIVIVVQTIGAKNSLAKVMAELRWIDQCKGGKYLGSRTYFEQMNTKLKKGFGQFQMILFLRREVNNPHFCHNFKLCLTFDKSEQVCAVHFRRKSPREFVECT